MTPDELRSFAADNHRAVLATRRRDGGVQMSPIAVVLDDDGSLIISSRETAVKVHNLRREPRGWLCILNDGFFGQWAQAEGAVTIESLPGAMDGLVRYYRKGFGEHPDWDDYRAAMTREQRVLIRMTIERVGPTTQG
jgi:PPOX class probable F420-dependent enzyme